MAKVYVISTKVAKLVAKVWPNGKSNGRTMRWVAKVSEPGGKHHESLLLRLVNKTTSLTTCLDQKPGDQSWH